LAVVAARDSAGRYSIEAVRQSGGEASRDVELATTAGGPFRRIAASGRIAALMGLEGGMRSTTKLKTSAAITDGCAIHVRRLEREHRWAGSSVTRLAKDARPERFRQQVIREMNRPGMMATSLTSPTSVLDIINTSTKPVIATHSAVARFTDMPRNLTDEMIRRAGEDGRRRQRDASIPSISNGFSEQKKRSTPRSQPWSGEV